MRLSSLIMMTALTMLFSGCGIGTHYVITSKFIMTQKVETPPEIVETVTYKQEASKLKTVALKAPSYCSNRSSDQRSGKATSQELVLGTNCAVDMAEIERIFSKASFKVISWTVLEREMERNTQQNSPLKVAENLGAQVLFQINSLEKSTKNLGNLGKDEKWEFAYFEADKNGKIIREKAFNDNDRQYLKHKFFNRNELLPHVKIPFVTLDANAIQVMNGESIWFYRWTHSDLSYVYSQNQLIYCKPGMVCFNDEPSDKDSETQSSKANSDKSAQESEVYSADEKPEDILKASYTKLLKEVTNNLVSSFSKR